MAKRLLGFGFILFAVGYSFWLIGPPAPKSETAPDDIFSAERAFEHVREIGQRPHPLGSEDNVRVRNYILDALRKMGFQPAVQQGIALIRGSGIAGNVKNILVKVPGTDPRKTVMLMAHYDSVPNGRGAADDGMGIAAILETLRAVNAGKTKPENNLWVLFTDGEERGLLGAEYFTQANDDWKMVDLVINVEARGTGGSSIMFETSSGNKNLISHFAAASPSAVANSLSYTVYQLIPNDTDLSVFKRAGISGLNFANVGGFLNYHTMQDRPENVSKGTLQHHGENLLAAARYFGNTNFEINGTVDAVYFNGPFGGVINYPASRSFPIAAAASLLFAVFLIVLMARGRINPGKYILGIFGFLLITGIGALLTYYGWQLMKAWHPSYLWLAHRETYAHPWYFWAFSALILGLSITAFRWLQNKFDFHNIAAGILSVLMILSLLIAWYLPTAGYLLTWPFVFASAGWAFTAVPSLRFDDRSWPGVILLALGVFPALFIIAPYIALVQTTLGTPLLWVSMGLLVLLIGYCWPLVQLVAGRDHTLYLDAGLFLIFAVCMIGAHFNSGFDPDHKKQNSIIFAQNLDTDESLWLSSDHATDEWTRQFLGENPASDFYFEYSPYWSYPFLQATAPYQKIEAPVIKILQDSLAGEQRHLKLQVASPFGGLTARFMLASGQNFSRVSIFDRVMFDADNPVPNQRGSLYQFYYFGDLTEPLELSVAVPAGLADAALDVQIITKKWPQGLMDNYKPRAGYMMPIPFGISDAVIFKKSYLLDTVDQ